MTTEIDILNEDLKEAIESIWNLKNQTITSPALTDGVLMYLMFMRYLGLKTKMHRLKHGKER